MKQRFDKFAGTKPKMTQGRIAAAGMVCCLIAYLIQPLPLCAGEVAEKFERTALVTSIDKETHDSNRPQQFDGKTVEPPAPADISANQPVQKCDDCKQSDVIAEPVEQRFRELEKSIHKIFLLSVVLIFIMRLFSR